VVTDVALGKAATGPTNFSIGCSRVFISAS
jgi:hypothetical protein